MGQSTTVLRRHASMHFDVILTDCPPNVSRCFESLSPAFSQRRQVDNYSLMIGSYSQRFHQLACTKSHCLGPLTRYVKSRVAHAPGMPGTFSPAAEFKGKRELTIPACITARASRTCRDACRDCLPAVVGKTFPAFPAHVHPQFDVFGKRPMVLARKMTLPYR